LPTSSACAITRTREKYKRKAQQRVVVAEPCGGLGALIKEQKSVTNLGIASSDVFYETGEPS